MAKANSKSEGEDTKRYPSPSLYCKKGSAVLSLELAGTLCAENLGLPEDETSENIQGRTSNSEIGGWLEKEYLEFERSVDIVVRLREDSD